MVMAIILFMGKVSGAHLNPAVSIAFSLRGDFPWRRVPGYIVVQLIGATLAALFLHALINVSASYGSNYPASGYSAGNAGVVHTRPSRDIAGDYGWRRVGKADPK
jgi:aquaporin Z